MLECVGILWPDGVDDQMVAEAGDDLRTVLPPASIAARVHALFLRPLPHNNPLLPVPVTTPGTTTMCTSLYTRIPLYLI